MDQDEQRQLDGVRAALLREFGDRLSPDEVSARFDDVVSGFQGAPIRTYVPVLTQRQVRQQLESGLTAV